MAEKRKKNGGNGKKVTHVVGSTDVYVLGSVAAMTFRETAQPVRRVGTDASGLIDAVRQLQRKVGDALGSLRVSALDNASCRRETSGVL